MVNGSQAPAHFLIAGDVTDLPLLQQMLSRLPVEAYGQVYIEIDDPSDAMPLLVQPGISVTWLVNDTPYAAACHGELAARAVLAWVSEWIPEEQAAHETPYVIWIGCSTTIVMERLYAHFGDRLSGLHLHHRHHG